jgi:hypothetical protein
MKMFGYGSFANYGRNEQCQRCDGILNQSTSTGVARADFVGPEKGIVRQT